MTDKPITTAKLRETMEKLSEVLEQRGPIDPKDEREAEYLEALYSRDPAQMKAFEKKWGIGIENAKLVWTGEVGKKP